MKVKAGHIPEDEQFQKAMTDIMSGVAMALNDYPKEAREIQLYLTRQMGADSSYLVKQEEDVEDENDNLGGKWDLPDDAPQGPLIRDQRVRNRGAGVGF